MQEEKNNFLTAYRKKKRKKNGIQFSENITEKNERLKFLCLLYQDKGWYVSCLSNSLRIQSKRAA